MCQYIRAYVYVYVCAKIERCSAAHAAAAAADAHCPTACVHSTYTCVRINTHTHTRSEGERDLLLSVHAPTNNIHTIIYTNTHILTPKDSGAREVIKDVSKETYCVHTEI